MQPEQLSQTFHDVVDHALATAGRLGATAAEAHVSESMGQDVTVRRGEVETIEHQRDRSLSVTVYLGNRRGHASSSDLGRAAVTETVTRALAIARHTAEDPCAGLPEPALLARDVPDLDLWHPQSLTVDAAIEHCRIMEAAAFAIDPRISNSEGASIGLNLGYGLLGNSLGFRGAYPASRYTASCSVIAGSGDGMQRDYWYRTARSFNDLGEFTDIGRLAGERALRRLDARKMNTGTMPVLFEAPVAASLMGHFIGAASGSSLYRRASFLLDSLDQRVFAPLVQLREEPHLPRGLASTAFDDEGVATHARELVQDGVLRGWFLGCYSARKLGMGSTGNAGGAHNLILADTGQDRDSLLRQMDSGLLVTELMGQGVNMVTGDYSRGASGFRVQDGQISHAVEEITIAGNLNDMYAGIQAIGRDREVRGAISTGSILLSEMMVAGSSSA